MTDLALLTNTEPAAINQGSSHKPNLPHRWQWVLSLHLAGYKYAEIAELTGYYPATIYQILKRKEVIAMRQQLMSALDDEFESLYGNVVQTIRECLESEDPKIRLDAADKWMKAHGKYKDRTGSVNITAEDVVVQILNQAR